MISTQEPKKIRKLQYLLEAKDFKKALIKRFFNDWAVTLEVHPWALGIMSQNSGNISVPNGATITCELVPNVFQGTQFSQNCPRLLETSYFDAWR